MSKDEIIELATMIGSSIGAAGESSAGTVARFEAFKKVIEAGKKSTNADGGTATSSDQSKGDE